MSFQVHKESPHLMTSSTAVARKMGFPDVIMPGRGASCVYNYDSIQPLGLIYSVKHHSSYPGKYSAILKLLLDYYSFGVYSKVLVLIHTVEFSVTEK